MPEGLLDTNIVYRLGALRRCDKSSCKSIVSARRIPEGLIDHALMPSVLREYPTITAKGMGRVSGFNWANSRKLDISVQDNSGTLCGWVCQ